MTARPTSVTVISWIQIAFLILGAIGLVITFALLDSSMMQDALARNHAPVAVQLTVSTLSVVINLICAIGFLKGKNWSRFLFIGWNLLSIIYTFWVVAITVWILVPGLILPVATVVIIFLPNANRFFSGKDNTPVPAEGG